jgi:hypothetical protein
MKLIDHKLDSFVVPSFVWRSNFHFEVYVWWHATWRVRTFLINTVSQEMTRHSAQVRGTS